MEPALSSSPPASQVLFDVSNFPKAADFLNAVLSGQYKVVCYGGAIRGGKTFNSLGGLTLLHKRYPGSRSIIVRDSLTTLKLNVLPSVDKAFPSNFIEQHNATDYWWRFTNTSSTRFVSENIKQDPELRAWNGLEFNFCLLEQCEELQERTFFKALERLGSYMMPRGLTQPPPILMLTVNPTDTWARKHFYEPYLEGTLPEGWLYIPARIDDNPHIAQSYKDSLEMMKLVNPVHYEKFVSGNWDAKEATGNEFYPRFEKSKHAAAPVAYVPGLAIYQSWDANSLPYCAMLCAQTVRDAAGKTTLQIFQEYAIRSPNSGLKSTAKQFLKDRQRLGWQSSSVWLTGDGTMRNRKVGEERETTKNDVVSTLSGGFTDADGTRVPGCLHSDSDALWTVKNPGVDRRRDFANYVLAGGYPHIAVLISSECTEAIADLELVQKGVDGKLKEKFDDKVLGVKYELRGHMSDVFDYLITTVFKDEWEAFKDGRDG